MIYVHLYVFWHNIEHNNGRKNYLVVWSINRGFFGKYKKCHWMLDGRVSKIQFSNLFGCEVIKAI